MNTTALSVEERVALLVAAFPIEDIWSLDAGVAKECGLDAEKNLILLVADGRAVSRVEAGARELLREKFPGEPVGVHVFPQSAMFQTPRPLLVKMAFTAGRHVYCG